MMRRNRNLSSATAHPFLVLALVLLGGGPLLAQTNLETNAGVQFNFSTPGAGNLALGGAFLALAFDASAAYTNPAGLTAIAAPETLAEVRHWNYTHLFTDRGRVAGQDPTTKGVDTIAGLRDGRAENQVTGLAFTSYVYPSRHGSFAIFRHELVDFEADFSTHGAYLALTRGRGPYGIPGERDARLASMRNRMDVNITAYGGAAAWRLRGLSLGLSVSHFKFSIDSLAERFRPELFSPANFASDPLVNVQSQSGEDSDWALAAGFLWESPRQRWSVGGVYRQGPDFTFEARSKSASGIDPAQLAPFAFSQRAPFHVPDVYGVGMAFRPSDACRLAFDYDRVRYSQLLDGFVDIFKLSMLDEDISPELDRFVIDDADELHLGAEYAFLRHWPVLTVRAGGWYEPDHSLRFEGENVGFGAVFRRRDAQVHLTAGLGLALRRLQLDLALDHSSRVSVVSLSAGVRY